MGWRGQGPVVPDRLLVVKSLFLCPLTLTLFPGGVILTHKFFCLVGQPFQAVRKSLAQVENLCHQKLIESTTSPLVGNA